MLVIDDLLTAWVEADEAVRKAQLARYDLEASIGAHMRTERAELCETATVTATFKSETVWDQGKLAGLAEIMPPDEFAALLTVPPPPPDPRVNVVKAKTLAKRGGEFRAIIEGAQAPGLPVLRVKVRTQ